MSNGQTNSENTETELELFLREYSVAMAETTPEAIAHHINMLNAISRVSGRSFYIIDYHKMGFRYVSPGPLFLCGHTVEEVMEMGPRFYSKVFYEEDLAMLREAHKKCFELLYSVPPEEITNLVVAGDFRLVQQGKLPLMIHHKFTPVLLTPSGKVWLAT